MALPTTLQRSRSAVVYIADETTSGQVAGVPKDSDAFGLTTVPAIAQAGNYADTSEIGSELITTDRVLNYMDYSTFDLEFYAKPGGRTTTAVSTSITSTAVSSGTVTITFSAGSHGINVGDTITVAGSVLNAGATTGNGTFKVTGVSGANVEYGTVSAAGVAINTTASSVTTAATSVRKVPMAEPAEHKILSKLFGGVKFNSVGKYVQGDSSDSDVSQAEATVYSYFLKNTIETVSVHSLQETDTTVQYYVGKGALPTSFSVSLAKDGPVTMSVGFQANKVLYAGTAEVNGAISGDASSTTATLSGPKRYASQAAPTASDVMWYESADAQGTPVKITDSNGVVKVGGPTMSGGNVAAHVSVGGTAGAVLTLAGDTSSPVSGFANGDLIIPALPEPNCDTTTTLDQRTVQVFMADQTTGTGLDWDAASDAGVASDANLFAAANALDVTAASIDYDRSITTPGLTEMTGDEYPPASYVINEPTISGSVSLLLRPKDFQFMASLRDEPTRSIGIRIGSTDGKIIEIGVAAAHFEVPTAAEADGATSIDLAFTAVRGQECNDGDKFFIRYR